jgi:hypothetical protein
MDALVTMRDGIRDFCRKYDEIITPILRFIGSLVIFMTINSLFGYSDLFNNFMVTVLLSVLCALLPDGFLFFMAGVVILVHSFCVSLEVGAVFAVLFIAMYCLYVRFFPKYAFVVLMVPVFYLLHMYCIAPLLVLITAGIGGIIPMAFGVVLYYFSIYAGDVAELLRTAADEDEVQAFNYVIDALLKNREMLTAIFVFAFVVLIAYIIYRMSFDYSWYVAIVVATVCNILFFMVIGAALGADVELGTVLIGSLLGMVLTLVIQFCKGIVDYAHTEKVQFEDDDYYYYVKAVPKISSERTKAAPPRRDGAERVQSRVQNRE